MCADVLGVEERGVDGGFGTLNLQASIGAVLRTADVAGRFRVLRLL